MPLIVITTLAAAVLFAGFHVPLPRRIGGKWEMAFLEKIPSRMLGVGYHLLMLPAVAALPAPHWGIAAGFAWMLLDVMLDTADLAGTPVDVRPFRKGVHVVAAVWLVSAGWSGDTLLALVGTAHAAGFMYGLFLTVKKSQIPKWLGNFSALFNILWIVSVAMALW